MIVLRTRFQNSGPVAVDAEAFFREIWKQFDSRGLLGIHEGTVLSEEAVEKGFETEPWIVDSGLAPESRDWIAESRFAESVLYFDAFQSAQSAAGWIRSRYPNVEVFDPVEEADQDWNEEWKKSFQGAEIPPYWSVIPPWKAQDGLDRPSDKPGLRLIVNPGAGFGTGTHETTRLCLESIARFALESSPGVSSLEEGLLGGWSVADFGSGSGILSVALARLGATVLGIEIDAFANENARENARLNDVSPRVKFVEAWTAETGYDLIVANILRPILIDHCDRIVSKLKPSASLILSGLIAPDVPVVAARYERAFQGRALGFERTEGALNEWRSLTWRLKP